MAKGSNLKPGELPNSRRKLTFRQHFIPPFIGMLVCVLTLAMLYSPLIAVKAQQRSFEAPKTVQAQPSASIAPDSAPTISIDKISVNAPVVFGESDNSEASFRKALEKGVVHYPGTAEPGQKGNVAIFGHSSGQVWAPGGYKFVFTLLEELETNDRISIDYKGTRYIYKVTSKTIVLPSDISVLYPVDGNRLTLITCSPVGTNQKRLIIVAEQVSPVVESASAPQTGTVENKLPAVQNLPASNRGIWQSILAFFN